MTRAFLTSEASARFSQDRIDAIRSLGALAVEHDAAFIVVAGDVFESNQISRETLVRAADQIRRLPVPLFLLPGNHDPLDGSSILRSDEIRAAGDHVHVLDSTEPVAVPGVDGVEVVGAPWTSKRPTSDLCAAMSESLDGAAGVLRVAVCHGQVDTLAPDPTLPELIRLEDAERGIRENRYQYLALGDRHSVTEIGNSGRIWYSGAPVATDFTEDAPNQALLVDLADGHCQVTPLAVGAWQFHSPHFHIASEDNVADFEHWLDTLADPARSVIKVSFEGSVNLATAALLEESMHNNAERFASLRRRERLTDLAVVPDALDEDSAALSGYAKTAWNELLDGARNGDDIARDALMLFYRLSSREPGA